MAGKADFTEQEWETLHKGVTGAGLLVSVSDRGFFDSFKEAGALAKHLAGARKDSSSQLVRELAETRGTGFESGPHRRRSRARRSRRSARRSQRSSPRRLTRSRRTRASCSTWRNLSERLPKAAARPRVPWLRDQVGAGGPVVA